MNKYSKMFTGIDCVKPTCNRKLPSKPLHFANAAATENGYCSWDCMVSHLGDGAFVIMKKVNEKSSEEKNEKT